MDRSAIMVGAVVLAAVGLFGLRFFSDREPVDDDWRAPSASREISERRASDAPTGGSDPVRKANAHSTRFGGAGSDSGDSASSGGSFGRAAGGSTAGSAASGHASRAVVGGDGGRGSGVGVSIGSRGGQGSGVSVGMAPGSSARSGSGGGSILPHERSGLVQDLSTLPPMQSKDAVAPDPAEAAEEVVLSVDQTADAEQASLAATGIEPPKDGVGINFSDEAMVAFPDAGNAKGDAGTITLDINPDWEGGSEDNRSLVQIQQPNQWNNRIEIVKNGRFLRFVFADNMGNERDISLPIDNWQPGQNHSIAATWGEAATVLYVDGRAVGQNTYPGSLEIPPGTPLYLGSKFGNYVGAGAKMENIKVYGRVLRQDEIH